MATYTYQYPHAALTTDCVVFGFDGERLRLLLIERGEAPFKGMWALPGGFLRMDETVEECARRELREETGVAHCHLEELKSFSAVRRDPRERVVTIAHIALVPHQDVVAGTDAAHARWYALDELPELAFDHADIIAMAVRRLCELIHFRPVAFELLANQFSMRELQTLYEIILDTKFDRRNFAKKMHHLGLLRPTDGDEHVGPRRFSFDQDNWNALKEQTGRTEF